MYNMGKTLLYTEDVVFVCSKLVEETFARIDALCQADVKIC